MTTEEQDLRKNTREEDLLQRAGEELAQVQTHIGVDEVKLP